MNHRNVERINAFRDARGEVLPLDCIHIDSSFLSVSHPEFPSQRQSNETICELAGDWLARDERNVVVLRTPANYGSEHLFLSLTEKLRQKIHICKDAIKDYLYFPELDDSVTANDDERKVRIHCCPPDSGSWSSPNLKCHPELPSNFIRIIRPTAIRWENWNDKMEIVEQCGSVYFVCYSNHASFNEIRKFVAYLKPKKVEFNVMPVDCAAEKILLAILDKHSGEDVSLSDAIATNADFSNIINKLDQGDSRGEENSDDEYPKYSIKRRKTKS